MSTWLHNCILFHPWRVILLLDTLFVLGWTCLLLGLWLQQIGVCRIRMNKE